jgi:hypothetical protein
LLTQPASGGRGLCPLRGTLYDGLLRGTADDRRDPVTVGVISHPGKTLGIEVNNHDMVTVTS